MKAHYGARLLLSLVALHSFGPAGFGQSAQSACEIRGTVTDGKGAPLESLTLAAWSSIVDQGIRTFRQVGNAKTDVLGHYCMANFLTGGPVFLAVNEHFDFDQPNSAHQKLPSTWYPGVPDLHSALRITPGPDAQANFRLDAIPTFAVEGTITGLSAADQIARSDSWFETPEGARLESGLPEIDLEHMRFQITGLAPPDTTFVSEIENGSGMYQARLSISGDQDVHDAVLSFAHEQKLELQVNGAPFENSEQNIEQGISIGFYLPAESRSVQNFSPLLLPGAWKLEVQSPLQCVESFSPGDAEVSGGTLKITARKYAKPIALTVGKNCATLFVHLPKTERTRPVMLIVPESLPFPPIAEPVAQGEFPDFVQSFLSPGTYRVYAFRRMEDLEYENPAALADYSGTEVELKAGQHSEIFVNVVNQGE